jgi:hypothetical protein
MKEESASMRKRLTAVLLGSGAAALALGIGATTAMATTATTWTVTPGGAVKGTAGTTTLKDSKTGTVLTCASSTTATTLKKGSGQTSPLGKITSVKFNKCVGPDMLTFTATASASPTHPWSLNAISYSNGVTKGSITKIAGSLSGNGCTATLGGATATSTGTTNGSYSNKTHMLTSSGGNLHVWNVSSGCLGLINSGDPTTFVAKYTISPVQKVTSP